MYIKVAMPIFLKTMLEKRNMYLLGSYPVSNSNADLIYGKEIIPHYQNEIVVFDAMYNPLKESTYKVIKL
ncbi:hypothetical protein BWK59_06365 [Flavobacterium davisii]|uniref:Uncharacterized protein n=2 Tax=Flavobacterium davisii TaxID=2906077 RepID=A0A246GIY9_9FLAO|nr:hypothetical protein BWK59_06365 [Flavobacterium davisii]